MQKDSLAAIAVPACYKAFAREGQVDGMCVFHVWHIGFLYFFGDGNWWQAKA